MPKVTKNCPVPFDQQPLNEYLQLKKSGFFLWSTYKTQQYIHIISMLFLFLFVICALVLFVCLFKRINLFKLIVLNFFIVDIIFLFIIARLYLGWSYIIKRLLSATIFYEESGWYDGQVWIKTAENLTRDRLLGLYHVLPLLNRIKLTFFIFFCNLILHYGLYYLV
uniref:Ycf36 n=1 Tax=Dipterocladia arabiensis TaxID=2007176 RepID=A0A1Z1M0X1_9FLOR|nr:hypothetical protein [Dipterocladia arabiensis]ARW59404.1 hypothetical protein [Dipterocladia arabiensis]